MIQFNGEYTGITRKCAGRHLSRSITFFAFAVAILLSPILAWFMGNVFRSMNVGISYMLMVISGILWFQYLPVTKKEPLLANPRITIGNDTIMYSTKEQKLTVEINQVESVKEFQEFFVIKAKRKRIYCQKSCLVEGSIEDFRAAFADKIQHCEEKELKKEARKYLLICIATSLVLLPISYYLGFVLK